MNILEESNKIINERSEEKERMYGPMGEGMERAAEIASASTGKEFSARDMYMCLIALKLSRHSYNYKEDNLLDAVAYLGALNNYEQEWLQAKGVYDKKVEELQAEREENVFVNETITNENM